jgi:hypothetical protein
VGREYLKVVFWKKSVSVTGRRRMGQFLGKVPHPTKLSCYDIGEWKYSSNHSEFQH